MLTIIAVLNIRSAHAWRRISDKWEHVANSWQIACKNWEASAKEWHRLCDEAADIIAKK